MSKMFKTTYSTKEIKRMKKRDELIKNILSEFALILTLLLLFTIAGYGDSHYIMKGTVVSTSFNGDICIEDTAGNLWDMANKGYCRGDRVFMMFFTDYTDNTREDDEIVKIKRIKK